MKKSFEEVIKAVVPEKSFVPKITIVNKEVKLSNGEVITFPVKVVESLPIDDESNDQELCSSARSLNDFLGEL